MASKQNIFPFSIFELPILEIILMLYLTARQYYVCLHKTKV